MNDILKILVEFFTYSIVAIGAQNAIFTRALGLSSGMRILNDPRKNIFYFCGALTVFQVMTSVIVYFVMPLISAAGFAQQRRFVLPTVIVMACTVSYVVVVALLSIVALRLNTCSIADERLDKGYSLLLPMRANIGHIVAQISEGIAFKAGGMR